MNEQTNNRLNSYEENEWVSGEIAKIFSENVSDLKRIKKLKSLKTEVSTQIARQHIEYFIKKINAVKYRRILKFFSTAAVTAYLIFTLFRVYWYYNPERNPFNLSTGLTLTDLIVFLYLVPIVLIIVHLIRKLSNKSFNTP